MNLTKIEIGNIEQLLLKLEKHYAQFSKAEMNFWYSFDKKQAKTLKGLYCLLYMSSKYLEPYEIWQTLKGEETNESL